MFFQPCAILHSNPSGAALSCKYVPVIGWFNEQEADMLRPETQACLAASGVSYLAKPFRTAAIATQRQQY
jgi:hypothetical protein